MNDHDRLAEGLLPRHIVIRRQYRERRYARHLSQAELDLRIRDIVLNLLRLQPNAMIGFPPISDQGAAWFLKFTHMLEEMQIRHGPYPAGFTRNIFHLEPFPNFTSELAGKAARRLSALGLKKGDVLIKYGKLDHMRQLHQAGALRIPPASYFSEVEHIGAVRDDELVIPISLVLSRDDVTKLVMNPHAVPEDAPDQQLNIQIRSPTDYWLYCVSASVEPRLFVDFNASACVIICDRSRFTEMLRAAAEPRLAGAVMRDGQAVYVDPLLPASVNIFVPLVKHFRYAYQEEYRFVWLPAAPVKELS